MVIEDINDIPLLKRKTSKKDSYVLPENIKVTKERVPIVSDTMYQTMINNSKRIKYPAYLISLLFNKDYNEIINNIVIQNENIDKDYLNRKSKRVDFLCKIDDVYYNIEMNNNDDINALQRNISYLASIRDKALVGDTYHYNNVVQINLNNFSFEGLNETVITFELRSKEGVKLTDNIKIIYVSLPLIRKKMYNKEKLSEFEKYMLILNEKDEEVLKELGDGKVIMEEYIKESKDMIDEENFIGVYDYELLNKRLSAGREQRKYNEGLEKGLLKGEKRGIRKGIKQGMFETAKAMLKDGLSIDKIMEYTNLTKEQIEKLA